jgi:ElaB/YqjD/DUF883 family membrane-anchored ribosome-binding protein
MDEGARAAGARVDPAVGEPARDRSPEEIREEIERTRAEVGDTVAALSEKTDVKAQARRRIDDVKANARQRGERLKTRARDSSPDGARQGAEQLVAKARENPAPVAIGGAVLLGFLLGRITGRSGEDYR